MDEPVGLGVADERDDARTPSAISSRRACWRRGNAASAAGPPAGSPARRARARRRAAHRPPVRPRSPRYPRRVAVDVTDRGVDLGKRYPELSAVEAIRQVWPASRAREWTAIMKPTATAQMPPNTIHSAQWLRSNAAAWRASPAPRGGRASGSRRAPAAGGAAARARARRWKSARDARDGAGAAGRCTARARSSPARIISRVPDLAENDVDGADAGHGVPRPALR